MSHNSETLVIVGGTLASIVAAVERARRGLRTTVVHYGGPLGGYFGGIEAGGRRWDAGMVLYEFTSFRNGDEVPPLASYDPFVRNDIGRFVRLVQDFVARYQQTRPIAEPEMLIGGHRLPDLLMANALQSLSALPQAPRIRDELTRIQAGERSRWHPSRKNLWPIDGSDGQGLPLSYDDVSRQSHGMAFHEAVISPFISKVLGADKSGLAALYHRMTWLPLYWPETLHGWLVGRNPVLAPTIFSAPVGEPVAGLVQRLLNEMQASTRVELISRPVTAVRRMRLGFDVDLAGDEVRHCSRLAWAQSLGQGLAACGGDADAAEDRLALNLAFLRVPAHRVRSTWSVMHLLDPGIGIYRATHVSALENRTDAGEVDLVLEANPEWFGRVHGELDDAGYEKAMLADLARAGLVEADTSASFFKLLRVKAALPLPTSLAIGSTLRMHRDLLERLPGIELIGPASGPFTNSFADQVVQGLALADGGRQAAGMAASELSGVG